MDGTVKIWVDTDADEVDSGGMNGLKLEHEHDDGGFDADEDDVDMVKVEDRDGYIDTHMDLEADDD